MKKIWTLILVFALLLPVLAGCQSALAAQHTQEAAPSSARTGITEEAALEIALKDAGLTAQEIRDLEIEMDRDRGILHYEVDFEKDGKDHDYEIDAETGEILKKEVPVVQTETPAATPAPTAPPATQAAKRLTKEEAQAIALSHAGLTADQVCDLEVEADREKGVPLFEVDFEADGYEYEYEIHAETGEILKSHKERD